MDVIGTRRKDSSIWNLAITWVLSFPLLCFALHGVIQFGSHIQNNLNSSMGGLAAYNQNLVERLEGPLILLLCAVLSAKYFGQLVNLLLDNYLFLLLGLLTISSALWSQFPKMSFESGVYQAMNIWFALYLAVRFRPQQQLALFQALGWVVVVASIALALFFPAYGRDQSMGITGLGTILGTWIGIFNHKNFCAIVVCFLLSASLYRVPPDSTSRQLRATFVVLALFLVVMTRSHTGWVVAAVLFGYVTAMRILRKVHGRDRAALVVGSLVVFIAIGCIVARNYSALMVMFGKDATLTGRTDIWQAAFQSAAKRPLLGYGYQAFWHGVQGESANVVLTLGFIPPHAHSGFLETWLELGVVGLLLFLTSIVQAFRNAYLCRLRGWSRHAEWCLCIVLLTVTANVAEITVMTPNYVVWIMYILACIGLNKEARLSTPQEYA
jgi:exopolysaccharide production protein ExoQ